MCDALRCAVMRGEKTKIGRRKKAGARAKREPGTGEEREQKTQLLVLLFLFWDPGAGRRVLSVSRQSAGDEIKIRPSDTMALDKLGI